MRDLEVGRVVRALRRRRGWRQADCAARASVHRSTWSRLERGHLEQLSLATLRDCLAVVEVRLDLLPHWRGAELDRLLDEVHATLTSAVHRRLEGWRWEAREEASFNHYGDRGRVDLLGWHTATRTLLIVEVKTEVANAQQLLGSVDVKRRLAPVLAKAAGWPPPSAVAVLLLIANSTTNRRRIDRLAPLFARFRVRGRAALSWLRRPSYPADDMLVFAGLSPAHGRHLGRVPTTRIAHPKQDVSTEEPRKSPGNAL